MMKSSIVKPLNTKLMAFIGAATLLVGLGTTGCELFGDSEPTPTEPSVTIEETPEPSAGYDPNDLAPAVANIPDQDALDAIFSVLDGYWITNDYPFVGFFTDPTSYEHSFHYGLFATEFMEEGTVIDGHATGQYSAELMIHVAAVPPNVMQDGHPEYTEPIIIDISGLYQGANQTIKVKVTALGDSQWISYRPGGFTLEEAFNNFDASYNG